MGEYRKGYNGGMCRNIYISNTTTAYVPKTKLAAEIVTNGGDEYCSQYQNADRP